ncbi:MAG TPA: flagellar FliJ family protein [Terriglobales bacterium]|nr:flagellar FliJ family protein [Terriglobales bacterium]
MAFRFTLAAVLKYRENIERREYFVLERIQQEIVYVEGRVRQFQEHFSAVRKRRDAELAGGLASIHLQTAYEEELRVEKQLDKLQAQLQELQGKRQQCLKTYQLARQKREVLDHLRVRQLEAYRRAQAKRQQSTLDDIFLSRHRSPD